MASNVEVQKKKEAKIHAIYMAAGNSSRFGANKLLHEINGVPLFRYGLDSLHTVMDEYPSIDLTIVTQYPEILDYVNQGPPYASEKCRRFRLRGLPYCERYQAVLSPDSKFGVSYTMQTGIYKANETYGPADYYLFLVADQPYLRTGTLRKMVEQVMGEDTVEEPVISAAFHGEAVNPKMFSVKLVSELLDLTKDRGGREIARKYPCRLVEVENAEEVYDIDYPCDLDV